MKTYLDCIPCILRQSLEAARLVSADPAFHEKILRDVPEVERLFLINVLDELDAAREWILLLGGHKATERLASFLLILSRRKTRLWNAAQIKQPPPIPIHLSIRRVDIAHYLGTRPETLSRAVHYLERAEAIRIVDPYRFEILDLDLLTEIAGHDLNVDTRSKR